MFNLNAGKWGALLSAFVTMLLVQAPPAKAQVSFATAGDILETCDVEANNVNRLICNGYIRGILRRDDLARWRDPEAAYVCEMPQGVTIDQIIAVVIKHIRARPEQWHYDGTGIALTAIREAFCNSEAAKPTPKN